MSDWELAEDQEVSIGDWELSDSKEVKTSKKPESVTSWLPKDILVGLMGLGRNLGEYGLAGVKGVEGLGQMGQQAMNQLPGPHPSMQPQGAPYSEQGQQWLNKAIPTDYAERYGPQDQGLLDAMIQGGITYAPEIAGGAGLARAGLKSVPHFTQRGAAKKLSRVDGMVSGADMALDPKLIEQSRRFLPRTQATQEMLGTPGYKPSFATQSQVGKHARDLQKSPLAAERLMAPEAQELKQAMVSDIDKKLRAQGYHDAADLLRGGLNDYRRHIQMRAKIDPILKKIGIPTTALTALGFGLKKIKDATKD